MHALIDGDVLKYSCGFASDANARKEGLEHESLNFCLHLVNKKIKTILEACGADSHTIFLSNTGSYRTDAFPEYKANRDPTHRPHWYKELGEFLEIRHKAVYSAIGDEADDALGIAQMSGADTIICTVDKDLNMIPGWHYNWSPKNWDKGNYQVSDLEGNRFFYKQLLTGDSTDNIPGLFKYKGVKASAKLSGVIDELYTAEDMYKYVLDLYNGDAEHTNMIARLLWIKRTDAQWTPPN